MLIFLILHAALSAAAFWMLWIAFKRQAKPHDRRAIKGAACWEAGIAAIIAGQLAWMGVLSGFTMDLSSSRYVFERDFATFCEATFAIFSILMIAAAFMPNPGSKSAL
jgi:hypothetical protein